MSWCWFTQLTMNREHCHMCDLWDVNFDLKALISWLSVTSDSRLLLVTDISIVFLMDYARIYTLTHTLIHTYTTTNTLIPTHAQSHVVITYAYTYIHKWLIPTHSCTCMHENTPIDKKHLRRRIWVYLK